MSETTPRRSLIAIVAVITLLGAAAVVRAASAWTATNASLDAKPADAQVLAQQLRDEQARSEALRGQLVDLVQQAGQLTDALQAAETKAGADATLARTLAAQLRTAQARLANLQAQLGGSRSAPATASSSGTSAPPVTPYPEPSDGPGDD